MTMKVRHVLRELHRLGLDRVSVEDDAGDRYSLSDDVKELPVVRIVIVPDVYAAPSGPVRSALGIDAADPGLDDPTWNDGEARPYVGEFS